MRIDGREKGQMRQIRVIKDYIKYPEGSVLIEFGNTKVICNVTVSDGVPSFLKGKGCGWITAEYSMLPRATHERNQRESVKGKLTGRTQEISRLIGRSLRSVVNLELLGERTITIDCDVIQADGGTRTASVSGSYISLKIALDKLMADGIIGNDPMCGQVCAVSVGILDDEVILDLNYEEDSSAETDLNLVATPDGKIVEIQGTAEKMPFSTEKLSEMIQTAFKGINNIAEIQNKVLEL